MDKNIPPILLIISCLYLIIDKTQSTAKIISHITIYLKNLLNTVQILPVKYCFQKRKNEYRLLSASRAKTPKTTSMIISITILIIG